MKDVQCCELFGGIAPKNQAFSFSLIIYEQRSTLPILLSPGAYRRLQTFLQKLYNESSFIYAKHSFSNHSSTDELDMKTGNLCEYYLM